jgi:flavin reductase (DIM6/NTAB) family NADH-FMN oxidoreductase RutF
MTTLIVSSFAVGISAGPPLVSCAVQHSSTTWPVLSRARAIGVSVPGEEHSGKARPLVRHRRTFRMPAH